MQHYSPFWLYFPAFAVVIVGLIVYFWHATRELIGFVRLWASAHHLSICSGGTRKIGSAEARLRSRRAAGEWSAGLRVISG